MKINIDSNKSASLNLLATLIYVFVIFFTFDTYSLTQVTPELVLMNMFGLPFARMELVAILFGITFAVGAVISVLCKDKSKKLLSLSLALNGVIALLIAVLDVDLLQSIFPTMRISHVIMTLSRLSAFAVGATGLFVGFNLTTHVKYTPKIGAKSIFIAVLTAFVLGILSFSEGLYLLTYILSAAILFAAAIISQYAPNTDVAALHSKCDFYQSAKSFLVAFAVAFMLLAGNAYMTFTLKFNGYACLAVLFLMIISYAFARQSKLPRIAKYMLYGAGVAATIVSTFVHTDVVIIACNIIIMAAFGATMSNQESTSHSMLAMSGGIIVAAVLAYVFNHYVSDVTTYSGNRVVYCIKGWFYLLTMGVLLVAIALQFAPSLMARYKEHKGRQNSEGDTQE